MIRPTPATEVPEVVAWLETFAAAVRERDYAAGEKLFDPDGEGFGTVADRYTSLEQLVAHQWRDVWERTGGFAFDLDSARCWDGADLVLVISEWTSRGTDARRGGRATVGLARRPDGLRAVHSHFSMAPGTSA